MAVIVKKPQPQQVLVDKDGRLTPAGQEIFDRLIKAVVENQDRLTNLGG